jgi:hypothetical protein
VTPLFSFHALRFHYIARVPVNANLVRGAFGSVLKQISDEAYQRYFAPKAASGPSGLADSPRPFVFRLREPSVIGLNVFAPEAIQIFSEAVRAIQRIQITSVDQPRLVSLPLASSALSIGKLRIHFLTPTELKPTLEPHFGVLMARIRDRVHNLNSLWSDGKLALDFKQFGARASLVKMTRCELHPVNAQRVSHGTGQRHPIGGFTGMAEYEGALAEFLPYLEIARHTGVGRQTVWGKGEIAYETF